MSQNNGEDGLNSKENAGSYHDLVDGDSHSSPGTLDPTEEPESDDGDHADEEEGESDPHVAGKF